MDSYGPCFKAFGKTRMWFVARIYCLLLEAPFGRKESAIYNLPAAR